MEEELKCPHCGKPFQSDAGLAQILKQVHDETRELELRLQDAEAFRHELDLRVRDTKEAQCKLLDQLLEAKNRAEAEKKAVITEAARGNTAKAAELQEKLCEKEREIALLENRLNERCEMEARLQNAEFKIKESIMALRDQRARKNKP